MHLTPPLLVRCSLRQHVLILFASFHKATKPEQGHASAETAAEAAEQVDYLADDVHAALFDAVKLALRQGLALTETALATQLDAVGRLIDKQIATEQHALLAAQHDGDCDTVVAHAWNSFALLRKRHYHGAGLAPQPLMAPPAVLRAPFESH